MAIQTTQELDFVIFSIDNTAQALQMQPEALYQKLQKSGLLQDYIVANYEVLHSQSKEYIVSDLIKVMQGQGLL